MTSLKKLKPAEITISIRSRHFANHPNPQVIAACKCAAHYIRNLGAISVSGQLFPAEFWLNLKKPSQQATSIPHGSIEMAGSKASYIPKKAIRPLDALPAGEIFFYPFPMIRLTFTASCWHFICFRFQTADTIYYL